MWIGFVITPQPPLIKRFPVLAPDGPVPLLLKMTGNLHFAGSSDGARVCVLGDRHL